LKKREDILGLPVMSISEGKKVGKVQDMVVNPEEGTVDYLLINDEDWYMEKKVLPFKDVVGIGEFAVTTESKARVTPVSNLPSAVELLKKNITVTGARVITSKGKLLGRTGDFYINVETGRITGCDLIPVNSESPQGIIPAEKVLTYAREFIVVDDSAEKILAEAAGNSRTQYNSGSVQDGVFSLFNNRQRSYLLGRKVGKRITGHSGEVIAEEGDIITEKLLKRVEAADKFLELSNNARD